MKIDTTTLQRNINAVLEQVKAGQTIELTRYGKIVAVLGPPPEFLTTTEPTSTSMTSVTGTAMDAHIAVSPTIRPEGYTDPQQGQRARDEMLNKINTGKRR